jgi:hypothetical protein
MAALPPVSRSDDDPVAPDDPDIRKARYLAGFPFSLKSFFNNKLCP